MWRSTDRKKQDAVYNYQGQRAYRPHIAFWAEGGVTLAADLMKADEDPRPVAAQLLDRADRALPPGVGKVRCRWDAGYFAADLAKHCITRGVEFAIGVKRNTRGGPRSRTAPSVVGTRRKTWTTPRSPSSITCPGSGRTMPVSCCIARRTRIPVELIPTDARARKLRTIDKDQLALALEGKIDYVYGYSFILTNLDVSTRPDWSRSSTGIGSTRSPRRPPAARPPNTSVTPPAP